MADNSKQWDAMVLIKTNIDDRVPDFVAGDLFWYPVEGRPDIVVAPDVFVASGRPKGPRRSYKQWVEGGVAPQVVFEILSPSNTLREMMDKQLFYSTYGAEEFYLYDPDNETAWGYVRDAAGHVVKVDSLDGWVSPRLGIRFDLSSGALAIFDAQGRPFEAPSELRARAEAESARADAESARADAAVERSRQLAEKLRALGIDPET